MKYLAPLSLLFMLSLYSVTAQVGINTTAPDASSILDIRSENKGLLIPRIELTGSADSSTIPNPVESLLIYNTATVADITPGFYFWTGTSWSGLNTSGSGSGGSDPQKWSITGNELTANDFIGSTNWSALQFKVNNTAMGLLHPNGGLSFGQGSAANVNDAISLGTNSSASENKSIAMGYSSVASGFQSTAIGYNSKALNSNNALAVGANSEASGLNSSALGNSATAGGQNATAIGYGANATNPNTIVLGNTITDISNWNASKVGIGTNDPTEKLQVNGNIKIVGGSLKITDGNQGAGKVLMSDANGTATWQNLSTGNVSIGEMYASNAQSLSQYNPIQFGNVAIANGINANSNNFQVTQTGTYKVSYTVSVEKTTGSDTNVKFFLTNGWGASNMVPGSASYTFVGNGDKNSVTVTKYVQLSAYNQLYVFTDTTNNKIKTIPDGTSFSIEFIQN
jgi:hypothetical protein